MPLPNSLARRTFLASGGVSLGVMALSSLLNRGLPAGEIRSRGVIQPLHHPAKIKRVMSITRPGVVIFLHIQGPVANEDRMRSLQLMSEYVLPDIRDHARQIGLLDQFEQEPGSVKLATGVVRDAVVDRDRLKELETR